MHALQSHEKSIRELHTVTIATPDSHIDGKLLRVITRVGGKMQEHSLSIPFHIDIFLFQVVNEHLFHSPLIQQNLPKS